MTKDELEKEAEEWVKDNHFIIDGGECSGLFESDETQKEAYLAGAEPREKQIQIDAEQIRALQKQNGELTDKVKELEVQIEKMKCCGNCSHFKLDSSGLYPIKVCEFTYPNRCKNHDKWEIKEK